MVSIEIAKKNAIVVFEAMVKDLKNSKDDDIGFLTIAVADSDVDGVVGMTCLLQEDFNRMYEGFKRDTDSKLGIHSTD